MGNYKLADTEEKFADLIWDNAPINSGELVRLSEDVMKWKKSTTYTVLKRLCDKGLFQNEEAMVSAVLTRDEFFARQSRRYVEDAFGGSLPKFITSFIGGKKLSGKQAEELVRLINEHKEGR
ncbi:MAG: BlaI/MecI/CopY family transcriptional regulator [Peptococcaceae bacterium]|nr:BlaI/MecI/CopY family transcriptional regulator [Peptococcaceae bacterium]